MSAHLPAFAADWFAARDWTPHPHQLALLDAAERGQSALLVAPTGGGKTLAGFLPSLVEIAADPRQGLHTLYISPLKALTTDVHRNLTLPIAEMRLSVTAETRTGDTPSSKRARQRAKPPHLLLTTPESLALMLSYPDGAAMFQGLRCVVVDELHAIAHSKRGDLLSLGLARLSALAPAVRRVGLSATIAEPRAYLDYLSPSAGADPDDVRLLVGRGGVRPEMRITVPDTRIPWAGHMAMHAVPDIFAAIKAHGTTIVFVNTRAQAEMVFRGLWALNDEVLPIAVHHGSLAVEQRRKVETAMAAGKLRAVVATSSLDLGIDWGAVDLVVQVGAPKGASRMLQRLGRSNHRLDAPSKALLVPANRFELLECNAAVEAVNAGELDQEPVRTGGLDVLAQHVTGVACAAAFDPGSLYEEVIRARPYHALTRRDFDDVVGFVATGGYALGNYERFKRLVLDEDGHYAVASQDVARRYRMNVGTIVEAPVLKVKLGRRTLGEVEEFFVQGLVQGDTFIFAGELLRFEGIREMAVQTSRASGDTPKVPAYAGGRLPLTTNLADRVRGILADPRRWTALPEEVQQWLRVQRWRSEMPDPHGLLVEIFPRGKKFYLVAYCFEGRNAHQTLGILLTRRMERARCGPIGFAASDYVLTVWSVREPQNIAELFDEDMLGDDLETWMADSTVLKRTFRNVAVIAGLIERKAPGHEKTGRQVTFNADLIYDVLRRHEPDHILLRATWADAAHGLTDVRRLGDLLARAKGRLRVRRLDRVSPLAVPVLLEIGKEFVYGGDATEQMLYEASMENEEELIAEAMAMPDTAELPL